MIVDEARSFTNADGGTLYITDEERENLQFAIIQNDSLDIRMGGASGDIVWPPVRLYNNDGTPNYANVSSYAALSGEAINIADVYHTEKFDFEGTRHFDARTGYRSQSMLVIPLRNHENDIIGVLQLLNARDRTSGLITSFPLECQMMTESLASQAAVALTNTILIKDLESLFESFIKTIATAVDAKSPYTGSHVRRVVDLSMRIATEINKMERGYFSDIRLNRDQMDELRIAAWLHDVGKVAVPEYVMDKATKLEGISDGINLLKTRAEVIKRDIEIRYAPLRKRDDKQSWGETFPHGYEREMECLDDDVVFLEELNRTSDGVSDADIHRLQSIARRKWEQDGREVCFLTDDEVDSLSVRSGTLTERERGILNSHTTIAFSMLSQIPFPKRLKNVPFFVASHHERINGGGYPQGLKDEDIPLQARIIAFADVFEALTASDRPYRKRNTLSQAIKILDTMVKDNHLDAHLFELFMERSIYQEYARKELDPAQIDDV
jgi:HD-GYP domain-containing protein (c-di-GMP phosphodiesterase class II)